MLPPLKQVITADASALDRTLNSSQARIARFAKAGAAAFVAVGAALVAMTRRSMQNADQLTKQARSIGLTTSALQAMSLVASEAGVSTESLTQSLGLMQRQIVELERGSATATRAFGDLGLSIKDLRGLSPDEQFRRIADALNQIQDPARRTAAAMEVFGRSGRQVINMLGDYSARVDEAAQFQERFGIAISQTDAEAIERANDAVARLREAFGGLGNILASRIAPVVERVAGALLSLAGLIADQYAPAVYDAEQAQKDLNAALGVFHETGAPRARNEAVALAKAMVAEAKAAYEAANAHRVATAARLASLAPPGVSTESNPVAAGIRAEADEAARAADEAGRNVKAAFDRLQMVMDELAQFPSGPMQGIVIGGGGEDDDGDGPIAPGIRGAGGVTDQMAERLEALRNALATEAEMVAEWYAEGLQTLNDALADERISSEQYHELRERLEREHQERLNAIRADGANTGLELTKGVLGSMLQAVQSGGDRLINAQKAISAALAAINVYEGITKALTLPFPQNFAVAAQTAAQGFAAISRLQSVSRGGGGAAGLGGAAGAGGTPALPRQNITIDLVGDTFSRNSVQELFEQLNRGLRSGYQIEGVLVR